MTRDPSQQGGQALVELAFGITLFMLLALGIIEFGRVLMIDNVITHAARHGARAGSVIPPTGRSNGMFTNASITNLQTAVRDQLKTAVGTSGANGFGVAVTQPTISGMNMVQIQVTGSIPYLFSPFLFSTSGSPPGLTINRTVTFRDEGR